MKRTIVSLAAIVVFLFAATVLSAYPDVCKTPAPSRPVPIPYAQVSAGSSASTDRSTSAPSQSSGKTSSRGRSGLTAR